MTRLRRLLCKLGHHPRNALWDTTEFTTGRTTTHCRQCGHTLT